MNFLRLLKRELSHEAQSWVNKGIISTDQAGQILDLYGARLPEANRVKSGYYILLTIASLLIGMAVIVIMGENWEQIPRALRMSFMCGAVLGCNAVGLVLYKKGNLGGATALFMLASLTYGAAIFLIAQIYHIEAHYPNGVFYWALGILPLALLLESKSILLLTQLLAALWAYLEFDIGYLPWLYIGFLISYYYFVFRLKPSTPIFVLTVAQTVMFFMFVLSHSYYPYSYYVRWGSMHVIFLISTLFVLRQAANLDLKTDSPAWVKDYAAAIYLWVLRLGILFFVIFTFKDPWRALVRSADENSAFALLNGVVIMVTTLVFYRLRQRMSKATLPELIQKDWLFIALTFFYCAFCFVLPTLDYTVSPIYLQVLGNIFMFATALKILNDGLKNLSGSSFYTGLGMILVQVFCRYIDLIGNYLGGAALFMIAGFIMILAARFWKSHESRTIQELAKS